MRDRLTDSLNMLSFGTFAALALAASPALGRQGDGGASLLRGGLTPGRRLLRLPGCWGKACHGARTARHALLPIADTALTAMPFLAPRLLRTP